VYAASLVADPCYAARNQADGTVLAMRTPVTTGAAAPLNLFFAALAPVITRGTFLRWRSV
jgi:hypothetical protein